MSDTARVGPERTGPAPARPPQQASGTLRAQPAPGRTPTVGPYALVAELGRGSWGVVYRARDARLDRDVALKLLRPGTRDPEALARFQLEIEALARLRHPNVVAVHGAGEHEGRTWVAMELVEGEPLQARLARQGPLPAAEALAIARDLAAALAHAHEHGVLHRDVKPANVLLTAEGGVRLADFGSACVLETTQLTETGVILGTPLYMAPEQITGQRERLGPATDLYALGATLYTALTGRAPFAEGRTIPELIELIDRRVPARPSRLVPGLPPAADAICQRCLEKDPARRYPDAAALVRALDVALGREVGPAPGPRAPQRRAPVGLALLTAGALLCAAAALGWAYLRPRPSGGPTAPIEPTAPIGPTAPPRAARPTAPVPAPAPRALTAEPPRPAGQPGVLRWNGELFLVELADGGRAQLLAAGPAEQARLEALEGRPVRVSLEGTGDAVLPRAALTDPRWFARHTVFLDADARARGAGGEVELPELFRRLFAPQHLLVSGWRWADGRALGCELHETAAVPKPVEVPLPLEGVDFGVYLQELAREDGAPQPRAPDRPVVVRWTGPRVSLRTGQPITVELRRLAAYSRPRLAPPQGAAYMQLFVHARIEEGAEEGSGWVPLFRLGLPLR